MTDRQTENASDAPSTAAPADDRLPPAERTQSAERLVATYTSAGVGVSLVPMPLFDLVALVGVQLKMLSALAKVYGVPFRYDLGRSAVASLLGGVLPVGMTLPLAASLSKAIPIVGSTLGYLTMPLLGGASTYAVGRVFIQHFESGGTFLTFDPERVRAYFAEQFEAGKLVAAAKSRQVQGAPAEANEPATASKPSEPDKTEQ